MCKLGERLINDVKQKGQLSEKLIRGLPQSLRRELLTKFPENIVEKLPPELYDDLGPIQYATIVPNEIPESLLERLEPELTQTGQASLKATLRREFREELKSKFSSMQNFRDSVNELEAHLMSVIAPYTIPD